MVKTTQHADLGENDSENDFYGSEEAEESMEDEVSSDGSNVSDQKPSQAQIEERFAYKGINHPKEILARLEEIKGNFYNRLESARLIKKQGHIPFTEHMSVSKSHFYKLISIVANKAGVVIPEALPVKDEIKREVGLYNMTRDNVM